MDTFYQLSKEETRKKVNGQQEPLTDQQVREHQEKTGKNELVEGKKKSTVQIFLEQYKDFLVIILIAAAIVSGFLGDAESAIVILVVITMNPILGTVQTVKAEQSLNSLKKLSGPTAKVLRNGNVIQVPSVELTGGDLVLLVAGDYVPADGRILQNACLKIDASALTGESLGVEKSEEVISGDVPLGDQTNMVFSGRFVTYGRRSFLVTGIGMETALGKIATLLKTTSEKRTPLQITFDQFGQKLSIIILIFWANLFGINVFRGDSIGDAFLFAVALAVAAIPEALSSIVTFVLSLGPQKMAQEHAIIRMLQAVEGLGSVSIICSDKTATLTQNKKTLEDYYVNEKRVPAAEIDIQKKEQRQLLDYSILSNDSTNVDGMEIGDPTETALIKLGTRLGVGTMDVSEAYPRQTEIPFDSDRNYMSTVNEMDGERVMITRGAVDVLLNRMAYIQKGDSVCPITDADKAAIEAQNQDYSRGGLRVLAFAYKKLVDERDLCLVDENVLIFLGLISMLDPPRVESAEALADCLRAGI